MFKKNIFSDSIFGYLRDKIRRNNASYSPTQKQYSKALSETSNIAPFIKNERISRFYPEYGTPYSLLYLSGENINIAKQEIKKINAVIVNSNSSPFVPILQIPISRIVFNEIGNSRYTLVSCNPPKYSIVDNITHYLQVRTSDNNYPAAVGNICYDSSGEIIYAEITIHLDYISYTYTIKICDGKLIVYRIHSINSNGIKTVQFECDYIKMAKAIRADEEADFLWLQSNISSKCPKSLSGYRRMKTQYTKNFKELEAFANSHGRQLTNVGHPSPIY